MIIFNDKQLKVNYFDAVPVDGGTFQSGRAKVGNLSLVPSHHKSYLINDKHLIRFFVS